MKEKYCPACQQKKPITEFNNSSSKKDGKRIYCRECEKRKARQYYQQNKKKVIARSAKWHKDNPEKVRASSKKWRDKNREVLRTKKRREYGKSGDQIAAFLRDIALQKKYGITSRQRDMIADMQDHRCRICGRHESELGRRLAVDHDHETGTIRGLICSNCNTGIGKFREDPELLEKAARYLRWGSWSYIWGPQTVGGKDEMEIGTTDRIKN